MTPFSPSAAVGPERAAGTRKSARQINAALREAYRLHTSNKYSRQASRRYLK